LFNLKPNLWSCFLTIVRVFLQNPKLLEVFKTIGMDLGKRILELRKEKSITREKLGKIIGTSGAIIGRYERNERTPSVEIARKMAQALGVSLDYLVGNTEFLLDTDVIKKIQEIQKLPQEDKNHLFYVLDNILQNVRAKQAFAGQ
jgi:transcriptional regulator with XRE-family HTH domain